MSFANKNFRKIGHNKMLKALEGYPGERMGKSLDDVRNEYSNCNKVYTENFNLAVGSNNDLRIDLPASARFLIGISWYSPFQNSDESPRLTYELNNTTIINKTPVRQFLVDNLQAQVFYPIQLPLSGQDTHIVDINEVTQVKVGSVIVHYI